MDATTFERAAVEALAAPEAERGGLARTALSRYTGDLLPADRYAAWATEARERLRQRYLELLDALAADARERGDLDEAVRLLSAAWPPSRSTRPATSPPRSSCRARAGAARRARSSTGPPRCARTSGFVASPRLERLRAATGRSAIAG